MGVKELRQLKSLTTLQVGLPNLTDAGAEELGELKNLKELYLTGQITDAGVKELLQLKGLTKLAVGSPKVTDAGAKKLGELKSLTSLDLTGCSQVTEAGIAELRKALPDAQITIRQTRSRRPRE